VGRERRRDAQGRGATAPAPEPGPCAAPSPASPSNSRRSARPLSVPPGDLPTRPHRAPAPAGKRAHKTPPQRPPQPQPPRGRPPDDVLRGGHRSPPKSFRANAQASKHGPLVQTPLGHAPTYMIDVGRAS